MSKTQVIVGLGSCGIAAGANKTYQKIKSHGEADKVDFDLKKTSCIGMCYREPLVQIIDETGDYLYGEIDEVRAVEIFEKHIRNNEPVRDYIVKSDLFETEDKDFIVCFSGEIFDYEINIQKLKDKGYKFKKKMIALKIIQIHTTP